MQKTAKNLITKLPNCFKSVRNKNTLKYSDFTILIFLWHMCSVYECTHLHAMTHWHLRRSEVNPRCPSSPSALSETEFLSLTSTASTTLPARDSPVSTPIFPQESWEYRAALPHPASCRVWWSKLRPSYFCITNQASFPAPKLSRCPLSFEYMYVRLCVCVWCFIYVYISVCIQESMDTHVPRCVHVSQMTTPGI